MHSVCWLTGTKALACWYNSTCVLVHTYAHTERIVDYFGVEGAPVAKGRNAPSASVFVLFPFTSKASKLSSYFRIEGHCQ